MFFSEKDLRHAWKNSTTFSQRLLITNAIISKLGGVKKHNDSLFRVALRVPAPLMASCAETKEQRLNPTDIDECSQSIGKLCAFQCVNVVGSYHCACPPHGYVMSANGHTCTGEFQSY